MKCVSRSASSPRRARDRRRRRASSQEPCESSTRRRSCSRWAVMVRRAGHGPSSGAAGSARSICWPAGLTGRAQRGRRRSEPRPSPPYPDSVIYVHTRGARCARCQLARSLASRSQRGRYAPSFCRDLGRRPSEVIEEVRRSCSATGFPGALRAAERLRTDERLGRAAVLAIGPSDDRLDYVGRCPDDGWHRRRAVERAAGRVEGSSDCASGGTGRWRRPRAIVAPRPSPSVIGATGARAAARGARSRKRRAFGPKSTVRARCPGSRTRAWR